MNRRFKFFWVVAIALFAVGFLVSSGMQETMVYSVTVKELLTNSAKFEGRGVRLEGRVVLGSLVKHSATLFEFSIAAEEEIMPVRYSGILPDTFRENHDVILEGEYRNGVFTARHIFTKCASKYEAVPEHDSTMVRK
ncbi:MAG: cytochrome c maturation protein CcmE [candidate division KSB1 bacterium]|nr:cytochrome c maturation protein CcmE [candidate division KSB1 bacterium]MDZ7367596.1 cytochrome c maturation protein CcmE [candidate division KSB1 bacterium]MDZ7405388.1 cytochrome c maturation protein CcmE [candidate division KSB1 bacterium]